MRRLVDTDEAARILGMSYHALIKRVQRGKIVGEFVPEIAAVRPARC